MRRRSLLTVIGASSLSLAGCAGLSERTGGDLPEECPTSQDLGVEWPRNLDESTVASFVEDYEIEYYRREVFDEVFEPQSRLDTYEGWIGDVTAVTQTDSGGWRAQFEGIVNIRRGDLALVATPTESSDASDATPIHEIEDELLIRVLEQAVESGRAEQWIGPAESDEYLDLFEMLAGGFELSHVGASQSLYFTVNGTTVELEVRWAPPNRDHFWYVSYYVDERVIWRSADEDGNPREGQLLECRSSG